MPGSGGKLVGGCNCEVRRRFQIPELVPIGLCIKMSSIIVFNRAINPSAVIYDSEQEV